jgi:hypothetical protein
MFFLMEYLEAQHGLETAKQHQAYAFVWLAVHGMLRSKEKEAVETCVNYCTLCYGSCSVNVMNAMRR